VLAAGALVTALLSARAIIRTRAVLLLGRSGRALAPSVLAVLWLLGLLTGQVAHSVLGMAAGGAVVMLTLALLVRRRFARLKGSHPTWTGIDWAMFLFAVVVFWSVDLWDPEVHSALIAQFLHGNMPARALNDPRFPLAYHGVYDAVAAIVMAALPIDTQPAMAIVSIACVALTLCNLQALSRALFGRLPAAQLGRALFMFGFGPIFIRCLAGGGQLDLLHGHSAEPYVELIMRRPAGLGMVLFTLAVALIIPCYGGESEGRRRALRRLPWLLTPILLVLPQASEEATLFLFVYLAPLLVQRRLPARPIVAMLVATSIGALQSGVVLGVLGHRSMATPTIHLAWPPRLPSWAEEQDGVSLLSSAAVGFYALELGPFFLCALALALGGRDSARRVIGGAFLVGAAVAVFASTGTWKKSDLDRFLFYGTPPVFMLVADLPDRLLRALGRPGAASAAALAGLGLLVCGPSTIYPGWRAQMRLNDGFRAHTIGGDLRRNLDAVGPREPVLTTLDRANELIAAGFLVIAPIETNEVTRVTPGDFDDYVRANASRAVWLFLPENDSRVAGRSPVAHDGGYVLLHAEREAPSNEARRL
jgi:hypothetical protein